MRLESAQPSGAQKLLPSGFMKNLRPEYYSDTEDRVSYVLDRPTLEYHLETITARNQTQEFEIFCRKLCERTICPNLRPQTGPEGGGDSKADTETYPIAEEIASLTYVGQLKNGTERWAFAFSAKEKWTDKVRSDVEGLANTGRPYDRIIFVTSRFARAKDRARLEDELSSRYGLPVTIHDRTWIATEIIEKDRKDLAFNYLGIGEQKTDPLRLGPTDYSRTQQLTETEKAIEDPAAFEGMERQRVTEALVAAKLSRNLERPRSETDGRFLRAIRLADADGSYRQKLEAKYEHIWTAFWWFDDVKLVNDSYTAFEKLALEAGHARNLEFLCNLNQLLVNAVVHNLLSREECDFDARVANLRGALEPMAANRDRPNNRLEAVTSLLIIRLNLAFIDKQFEKLPEIWRDFSAVLDDARGLGEFDVDRLAKMIELGGNVAGNDPSYTDLIEKLAAFVSSRTGEAEGALILLKRAQKLDFSDHLEMIRLLGKAAAGLSKKEYSSSLIEASQLLMLAYRSAGLLWAARASCVFTAATIAIEGEETSLIPARIVPVVKIWAWIALQMRHLPDMLHAIQILNGALAVLPLAEESKEKVQEDLRELDRALGSVFLNLTDEELRTIENVPDILEGLGLFIARTSLLFALGHSDVLRADGNLPASESDEDARQMFSILASQPVGKEIRGPLILNDGGEQTFSTTLLGMTVQITFDGSDHGIVVAETVLGALEAFFSTTIDQRVVPHTELLRIGLTVSADVSEPSFDLDAMEMKAILTWPSDLSPNDFGRQNDVQRFIAILSGQVLLAACALRDPKELLEKLYADEAVQQRFSLIAVAPNSYHRVTSAKLTRLSYWDDKIERRQSYTLRLPRPPLDVIDLAAMRSPEKEGDTEDDEPKNHQRLSIRSVIDVHAWDKAAWKGIAWADMGPRCPPAMAFMFSDEEAGKKIFERWRARFGERDADEEIYIAIVRQLPGKNPHHYVTIVTSKPPERGSVRGRGMFFTSRSLTMEPNDSVNIERFLTAYHTHRAFLLVPALLRSGRPPDILFDRAIIKRDLTLKLAAHVDEGDVEAIALNRPEVA